MFVYFIQASEGGPVKIGRANNVRSRMGKMQTDSAALLVLLGASRDLDEEKLHVQFAGHRLHGEWFEPAPEILALAASVGGAELGLPPDRQILHYLGVPSKDIADALGIRIRAVWGWSRRRRRPGLDAIRAMIDAFPGRITADAILDYHCPPGVKVAMSRFRLEASERPRKAA